MFEAKATAMVYMMMLVIMLITNTRTPKRLVEWALACELCEGYSMWQRTT